MKKTCILFLISIFCAVSVSAQQLVQEPDAAARVPETSEAYEGERLTQEEFAVELVKLMKLDGRLPTAALAGDCVDFLEKLGIMPLRGWDKKALLTQEDYLVLLAKVHGKEKMLHERAMAVEEKNIQAINQKWKESFNKTGRWVSLDALLGDKQYFPQGAPSSPYGIRYRDRNGDHKVDRPFLPVMSLLNLREALSTR